MEDALHRSAVANALLFKLQRGVTGLSAAALTPHSAMGDVYRSRIWRRTWFMRPMLKLLSQRNRRRRTMRLQLRPIAGAAVGVVLTAGIVHAPRGLPNEKSPLRRQCHLGGSLPTTIEHQQGC